MVVSWQAALLLCVSPLPDTKPPHPRFGHQQAKNGNTPRLASPHRAQRGSTVHSRSTGSQSRKLPPFIMALPNHQLQKLEPTASRRVLRVDLAPKWRSLASEKVFRSILSQLYHK